MCRADSFDQGDLVRAGPDFRQVGRVRSRKQSARLKEMDVRVDVTGQNEFAFAIDDARTLRATESFRRSDDIRDAISIDQDRCVREKLVVLRIDDCPVDKRNFFGLRTEDCQGKDETRIRFSYIEEIVAALVSSAETKRQDVGRAPLH